ncbi:uracil-DNA glycosylase family protein [Campylobacter pinnipediorum subsp. caledonicus]|uniref:Uracil-DNA glycosylase family protein n=1 Tax=Campylobacter pinnipediorum subsp. caledonicus TaxID=1874362 RepID=A0A1S6U754_9BACT|nr:uracil-DNA glycosylase family protein [Campylobacter pinnipediorum]AQW85964.1 uracil-DNA glycosylase family protein [Campylobacter pinnipediorum subsp. caledonicus]AQW87571.1 uracil-DNA glycosylase family protein [Campylobacter pinnipediorum subsp. caledonicus]OPA72291.1 hypothetical protein BB381_01690 [Campylobacter pinnipediorum subsp. caledonicus]
MNDNDLKKLYFLKAIGYNFVGKQDLKSTSCFYFDSFDKLNNQIINCNLCCLKNYSVKSYTGFGNINSKIIFVMLEPNLNTNIMDNFFELLRKYLKFSERDFYISYLLHCKKQMSLDLSDCFFKCRPYLDEEMNFIKPKIIVALGEDVFLNLYIQNAKNSSFESLRGSFLKFGNAFLMATYSLDKIIKNPSLQANFINDLNKIKDVL